MPRSIRYGDYVQAITVDSERISYSNLMPSPQLDAQGREIPIKPEKLRMTKLDV